MALSFKVKEDTKFFLHFTKGNNFCDFLFDSLDGEALPKWGPLLRKEFAPRGANFFVLIVDPL